MQAHRTGDELGLHWFTRAFVDAAREREYAAHIAKRFSRRRYAATTSLSALMWAMAGALLIVEYPEHQSFFVRALGGAIAVLLASVLLVYLLPLAASRRWMPPVTFVTTGVLGLVPAIAATVGPHLLIGLCIYLLTLHSFLGLRFVAALALTLVLAAAYVGALVWSAAPGLVVADSILWLSAAQAAAMFVSYVQETQRRRVFHQSRLLEEQNATIVRERARSEELLKRELSHQVAERSRELGAVLARSDVTLDVRRLDPGERFAERYKIVSALGAGGMGAVYEVERVTDGEKLALKAVVGEVTSANAARFAREAEIGARIRHPNLISIVDVGVSSGVPFLVMELVRGGSLESQRSRFGEVGWALPILRQIAEGLAALHDAAVVHRDLKPANVLLANDAAKISDFGISRFGALDDAASIDPSGATLAASPKKSAELTGTGVVMGTPLYMAPEGVKSARALDASADVFAFGIIAYEMLTGRAPFAVPAFVLAMAEQPIPVPPPIDDGRVTAALRALVSDCLGGEPTQRPRVRAVLSAFG